jgi:hypothetical protein
MRGTGSSGFVVDGYFRLCATIRHQVQREFEKELAGAAGYWARVAIKKKMADEVRRRMDEVSSPQSLW